MNFFVQERNKQQKETLFIWDFIIVAFPTCSDYFLRCLVKRSKFQFQYDRGETGSFNSCISDLSNVVISLNFRSFIENSIIVLAILDML